ncbi:hypothetical protein [Streptomyces sp. NPDC058330]|uniref:hypothetical protein n=1 Tax=Streptomyces sp. NPDC058330 TaxID=3346449 RepID=UPI0036E8091A
MENPEGRPPPPGPDEPLPWFGSGGGGSRRFTALRRPKDTLAAGILMLALGVGGLVAGLDGGRSSRESTVSDLLGSWGDVIALLICLLVSGLGVFLCGVGAARHLSYRRCRRAHGRPPF